MSAPLAALTVPQFAALELLLEGRTQSEAAAGAAVDVRTVRRWLAQPHFRAALCRERAALAAEVHGRLQAAAFRAVEALDAALLDTNDVRIRIRAAQLILQLSERALAAEACALQALTTPHAPSHTEPLSLSPPGPRHDQDEKPDKPGHPCSCSEKASPMTEAQSSSGRASLSRDVRAVASGAASAWCERADKSGHPRCLDAPGARQSLAPADKSGHAARVPPCGSAAIGRIKRRPPSPGRFQRLYLSPPGRGPGFSIGEG